MTTLLDTNILVRSLQPDHRDFASARLAVRALRTSGLTPVLVSQVLYEFWAVATRPHGDNGLGLAPEQAAKNVRRFRRLFPLLTEPADLYTRWERLVRTLQICGKSSHDARLAAAMQCHHVDSILTFNRDHFTRFPGLRVMTPAEVLSAS